MSEIYMTLDGVSCKELGLHCKTERPVLPELEESLIEVSGRDGSYDYQNNTYKDRLLTVDFFILRNNFESFRLNIRDVAAWLRRKGRITFSDEPDKYYIGRCYQSPPLEQVGAPAGRFSAVFTCEPFAYAAAVTEQASGTAAVTVPLDYPGTYKTPCKIIIRNIGTTDITNIDLTHIFRRV